MDAIKYLKGRNRMTNNCGIKCEDCKLSPYNNGKDMDCVEIEHECPEQAIKIVEDWSKEHPVVTNKDKYLKVMKETFGIDNFDKYRCNSGYYVPEALCNDFACCENCEEFWKSEYKKINK